MVGEAEARWRSHTLSLDLIS